MHLALALLVLGSSVGSALHLALVPHLTLLAAGDFVETDRHDLVTRAVPAHSTVTGESGARAAAPLDACPVCALYDTSRRDPAAVTSPPSSQLARDPDPPTGLVVDRPTTTRVAILRLAPKTSPPA